MQPSLLVPRQETGPEKSRKNARNACQTCVMPRGALSLQRHHCLSSDPPLFSAGRRALAGPPCGAAPVYRITADILRDMSTKTRAHNVGCRPVTSATTARRTRCCNACRGELTVWSDPPGQARNVLCLHQTLSPRKALPSVSEQKSARQGEGIQAALFTKLLLELENHDNSMK